MVNYRAFNSILVTSGSADLIDRAWGILPVSGVTGTITLEGGGTISLATLSAGEPFPCYVKSVTVTNGGSVYVLAYTN
jgi:hypothetical protein